MVKSVVSMICVFFILLFFGIYENLFITKNFSELIGKQRRRHFHAEKLA